MLRYEITRILLSYDLPFLHNKCIIGPDSYHLHDLFIDILLSDTKPMGFKMADVREIVAHSHKDSQIKIKMLDIYHSLSMILVEANDYEFLAEFFVSALDSHRHQAQKKVINAANVLLSSIDVTVCRVNLYLVLKEIKVSFCF